MRATATRPEGEVTPTNSRVGPRRNLYVGRVPPRARRGDTGSMEPLAFYCVCDRSHFLGLVGLINSLRILGHKEHVYVLDCGLTESQRELVAREAVVVSTARDDPPVILKHVLPLSRPAEVMVLVDVDVIFTRNLAEIVNRAKQAQKPVLFLNDVTDRFHSAWVSLGFGAPVPHPYVNSGMLILPGGPGRALLEMFEEAQRRLDPALVAPAYAGTQYRPNGQKPRPEDPFYFPDQDVLNAMIGTAVPLDSVDVAPENAVAYWPFPGLRVTDVDLLECHYPDSSQPFLLHHILTKPWNGIVAPNVYTDLLTRLLCGSDVAIRVETRSLPRGLRAGWTSPLARQTMRLRAWLRGQLRGRVGLRAWFAARKYSAG